MTKPKFKVGQVVRLTPGGFGRRGVGVSYEIMRLRPFSEGEFHYFVRNRSDAHERSVRESEIVA
jgi:hypothetical protein